MNRKIKVSRRVLGKVCMEQIRRVTQLTVMPIARFVYPFALIIASA